MAHLLLVQEFGSNLGHINRLLAVARALPAHRYTMIVPHPALAAPRVRAVLGPDVRVLRAPRFAAPGISWPPTRPERTFADVFHTLGYHSEDPLEAAARGWLDLLERLRPDLILSDFAATLRIANRSRIPVVGVADCFSMIPPGHLCPPVMPDAALDDLSAAHEGELLETARRVALRLGAEPLGTFGELFSGDVAFPIGVRMIDPYAGLRDSPQRPSISLPGIRSGPASAARTGPPIFCYLWPEHPALGAIVSALNRLPVASQLHVRGLDPAALARHCAPHVGVRTAEADFSVVLPQSRLFMHYGGGGASYAGLLAGTVQFVMPTALEQDATAARLAKAGAALAVRLAGHADPDALAGLIASALQDPAKEAAALRLAAAEAAAPLPDTLGEISSACERLLGAAPRPGSPPSDAPHR